MNTLYLLPFNEQEVQFSLDKRNLEVSLNTEKGLPHNSILEIQIDEYLTQNLQNSSSLDPTFKKVIPEKYYKDRENFIKNTPDWHKEYGNSIYVIFDKKQRCFWSPSENNLNNFYDKNPGLFLSKAIRVDIDKEAYINLYAYFEFIFDNF